GFVSPAAYERGAAKASNLGSQHPAGGAGAQHGCPGTNGLASDAGAEVMAVILDIADAVVAQLNGTPFSQPLTAERHYQPKFELSEMTDPKVSVVPRSLSSKALDRNRDSFEYLIDIAVQKKTDMTQASLGALMSLVEEIADHFRTQPLAG